MWRVFYGLSIYEKCRGDVKSANQKHMLFFTENDAEFNAAEEDNSTV